MSLSLSDTQNLSKTIKTARKAKNLTQAECSKLLGYSASFQKDLERGRCLPSIENFFHICRTLDISADQCIFYDSSYSNFYLYELTRLATQCKENQIKILILITNLLLNSYNEIS